MPESTVTFTCPHCGQSLEAGMASVGKWFECPRCKISVRVPSLDATRDLPRIERRVDRAGTGCLFQLIGLVALCAVRYAPLSTIAGILLIIMGARRAVSWRCPRCKNPVATADVSLCPSCHTDLSAPSRAAEALAWLVFVIIALVILYLTTSRPS